MNSKKWMGIEIGGTKLQIVVGDAAGTIEQKIHYRVDATAGATGIQAQLQQGFTEINFQNIGGIGVGFGGPIDWRTGVVQTSHQLTGWAQFPLKDWLQKLTGVPVRVDNDANVAALAEAVYGSGKGHNPVFYMTIGSGIGGGVIINKKIYHGTSPGEVEIGHVRLDKNGNTLESECSGWAVNKKVRAYINQHPESLLAQLALQNDTPEAALLKPALEKGDAAAQQLVATIGDDLAFALSHVVHLFHPQIIIIGGGLSVLDSYLCKPVMDRLPHYVMNAFLPIPLIQIAALRENVVPIGALALAKETDHHT